MKAEVICNALVPGSTPGVGASTITLSNRFKSMSIESTIDVHCNLCKKPFTIRRKFYLDKLRENKNCKFYCSKECVSLKNRTGKTIFCLLCNKEIYISISQLKSGTKFCSQRCAASFNNNKRKENNFTTANKKQKLICNSCHIEYEGSIHTAKTKQTCNKCKLINFKFKKQRRLIKKNCSICSCEINHSGKYCTSCRSEILSRNRIAAIKEGKTNFKSIKCSYNFNDKIIKCDSKIEYACLDYFQLNFNVINIERADCIIPYSYNNKKKNYLPDFKITTSDSIYIVECKSNISSKKLNKKWHFYNETARIKKTALEEWCAKNGFKHFWFKKEMHYKFYNKLKL